VAVGFGIATPEQAGAVAGHADGIIIGSRLVRMLSDAGDAAKAARKIQGFLQEVRAAL
jgi:tryptophan synthase alpha chain